MTSYEQELEAQIQQFKQRIVIYQNQISEMEVERKNFSKELIANTEDRVNQIIREKDEQISKILSKVQENTSVANHQTVQEAVVLACPDCESFSVKAWDFVRIVDQTLTLLDKICAPFEEDDDVNYFYVHRRMKFYRAVGAVLNDMYEKWLPELKLLVDKGVVVKGSIFYQAIGGDGEQAVSKLRYYLYKVLFYSIAGPTIILLRELAKMEVYVDVENVDLREVVATESKACGLLEQMGYQLVDVELFQPLKLASDVDCVEHRSDIDLPNLVSGDVYEIVKLAVNFGAMHEHSEVKTKN